MSRYPQDETIFKRGRAEEEATATSLKEKRKEPYFGSVRFFKHLILTVYALLILIPLSLCILFGIQRTDLRRTAAQLNAELKAAEVQLEELQRQQTAEPEGEVPASEEPAETAPEKEESEQPDYEALFPELYAPERTEKPAYEANTVYLTFDDGPSSRTQDILNILDEYGVKATFFVVGRTDEAGRERMKKIVESGHAIGLHSFSHSYEKIYGSVEAYLEDMDRVNSLVVEATGQQTGIFRFPGGSINGYNSSIYQELISEMTRRGFVYFDWNVTNGDGESGTKSVATTEELAKKGLGNKRAIILMHDNANKPNTVKALPGIIKAYQDAGYTFGVLTPGIVPIHYGY